MKYKYYFLSLLILFLTLKCWNHNGLPQQNNRIGQQIFLPSELEIYSQMDGGDSLIVVDQNEVFSDTIIIILYFRADCSSCFHMIEKWNIRAKELKDKGISVLIVLNADDNFELFKWTVENRKLSIMFPVILDISDDFLMLNNLKTDFNGPLLLQ